MGQEEIIYLIIVLSILVIVNLSYKKFPRNHEKLFEMLIKDK